MHEVLVRLLTAPGRRWCSAASAVGVLAILFWPTDLTLPLLCGELSRVPARDWQAVIGPISPTKFFVSWLLMLVAMMPPQFAEPMRHVWFSSLRGRRIWSVFLCALGYLTIWVLAAPVIVGIAWLSRLAAPAHVALMLTITAAFAWSASPLSQHARNGCHRHLRVGARGRGADLEALAQGLFSGSMCVVVCWPWMLVPLLVSGTAIHVVLMLLISLWLTLDRIYPARPARWQCPPVVAQLLWHRQLA